MDTASYYRELGLRSGASLSQVKASYRRLARQYHPDVNPGDDQAKNKFIAITEAYKFLLTVAAPDVVGGGENTSAGADKSGGTARANGGESDEKRAAGSI